MSLSQALSLLLLYLSHSLSQSHVSVSFSLTHSFSLSHSCSFLTRFPRLSLQSLCLIDLVSLTLGLRLLSALVFSLSLTLTSLVSLAFVLSLSPSFSLSLSQLSLSVTRSLSYTFPRSFSLSFSLVVSLLLTHSRLLLTLVAPKAKAARTRPQLGHNCGVQLSCGHRKQRNGSCVGCMRNPLCALTCI